jgi:hypothetical protein
MTDIDEILNEREKTHGDFEDVARVSQEIKDCFVRPDTSTSQDEALDMIANKIARICCGNPNEVDHWRDIAGYATLVVRELEGYTPEQKNNHDVKSNKENDFKIEYDQEFEDLKSSLGRSSMIAPLQGLVGELQFRNYNFIVDLQNIANKHRNYGGRPYTIREIFNILNVNGALNEKIVKKVNDHISAQLNLSPFSL